MIDGIQAMCNPKRFLGAQQRVTGTDESTGVLMQIAKGMDISIFIVGHVTKEGVVANCVYWNIWWIRFFILKRDRHKKATGFCVA